MSHWFTNAARRKKDGIEVRMIKRMQHLKVYFCWRVDRSKTWKFCLPLPHCGSCKVTRRSKVLSCQVTVSRKQDSAVTFMKFKSSWESFYNWFGKNSTCSLPTSSNPARDVIRHLATRYREVQNQISKYSMKQRGKENHNQLQRTHPDLNKNPGGSKAETVSCHNLNISLKG